MPGTPPARSQEHPGYRGGVSDAPVPIHPSDDERSATEATLRAAVVEGRITLDEFGDRVGQALATTSRQELDDLTADLPAQREPSPSTAKDTTWIFGIFGGGDRTGRWRLSRRCRVVNVMGGNDLDLRAATISSPITDITVVSVMGGSDIIVPDGIEVDAGGFALFGGNDVGLSDTVPPPGAPIVRIRAYSLMGGTDITRG